MGPLRERETQGWRHFHIEEPHDLVPSPNIFREIKSRRMRWVGHVAHMGKMINAYKILTGKPEKKRLLWRPMHRWEGSIKMDV
jgi:hypothetical protein